MFQRLRRIQKKPSHLTFTTVNIDVSIAILSLRKSCCPTIVIALIVILAGWSPVVGIIKYLNDFILGHCSVLFFVFFSLDEIIRYIYNI